MRPTLILALAVTLAGCGQDEQAAQEQARALAAVLNAARAEFTTITVDRPGILAIETSLYPKPENEMHAMLICGPVVSAALTGDLPGIEDVRVRASDGSTLVYCEMP